MQKILVILLFVLTLQADDEYQLGEGLQLGSLPFYVGGYFSVDYQKKDDYERYRLDDLAFLGYGSYSKFSYLVELEYKELYVKTDDHGVKETNRDTNVYTERLYLNYSVNDNYMLRVGKYYSPIGFWNLLPINVLRETTSNPITSSIIFPKLTTGVAASYSSYLEDEIKIDIVLQHNNDIDDEYNNYNIDRHYGLGLTYAKSGYTYKINSGYFHSAEKIEGVEDDLYYFLASAKYESDNYEISTEIGTQKSEEEFTTQYAAYLQGVYRFTEKHIGIIRLESYDDKISEDSDSLGILAYTYRPLYPIALKSEYQFNTKNSDNQLLLSFSVLF